MPKPKGKPKLPRAPLPRQTEKVHSPRKKPLPAFVQKRCFQIVDDEKNYLDGDEFGNGDEFFHD